MRKTGSTKQRIAKAKARRGIITELGLQEVQIDALWQPLLRIWQKSSNFADKYCGGIPVTIQRPTFEPQANVAQTVAQTVAQDDFELSALQNTIYKAIANNNKITRAEIAKVAGVSLKTIEREIKKMPFLKYVGSGYSGYWTIIKN